MNICIIGAFDAEITKLIEIFNLKKERNKDIYTGTFNNKNLIVSNSGIGKVNSAAMTQYLIDTYNPNFIINSGCAGSLNENIKIMDIILSSYVTYHDFLPIRVMKFSTPNNGQIKADKKLIEISKRALSNLNIDNYYIGPIASGDCFVTNSKMRDSIRTSTDSLAVDMESGSIGHISTLNNIPFISIRTISDFADGNDDFEKEAAFKSSLLVNEIINLL